METDGSTVKSKSKRYETEYLSKQEYISMKTDCEEIRKMLSAITKTLKNSSLLPNCICNFPRMR